MTGVATWPSEDPNYTSQSLTGTSYPLALDAAVKVGKRPANWFAPHEQTIGSPAPEMSVRIEAGWVWDGTTLTEVAAQTVSGFTTPSSGQHRFDRVALNPLTGACSRIAGTAATGSPSAVVPAITAGLLPICNVLITSADTAITNSMITDERGPQVSAGLVKLNSGSVLAAATLDIVLSAYTGFKTLLLKLERWAPATDDVELWMRTSTDGGSTYDAAAANYKYAIYGIDTTSARSNVSTGATEMVVAGFSVATLGVGNAAGESLNGQFFLHNFSDATFLKMVTGSGAHISAAVGPTLCAFSSGGYRAATADIDAIRLLFESGNIASGDWTLYGLPN